MTDSGFSSAASQRSASSIIRPTHINSFSNSLKSDLFNLPSQNDEKNATTETTLPKPCIQYQASFGRPAIPNRLIYGNNHGGYSPSLSPFSNQEMSPMSSLTYDFKDLSTSQNSSVTPRKRLSLSSVSSLDSPRPSSSSYFGYSSLNQTSPLPSSISSASSSNSHAISGEGGFTETPTPSTQDDKENRQVGKSAPLEQRGENLTAGCKKFRALPHQTKGRMRFLGIKENRGKFADKENDPKISQSKSRTTGVIGYVDSPMGLSDNFSPIGTGKMHKHSQNQGIGNMMSSPLVNSFSHGKSSAFKVVSPNERAATQVKRKVLASIDGNIPAQRRSPPQPTKASGQKRLLEESITSVVATAARKRKCSKSLNAKSAFSQERKTKSADAITTGRPLPTFASPTSPLLSRMFTSRPISAPVLVGNDDDDDYVLSHSSLCSRDSDDEELKSTASGEGFSSTSCCREDEIESMMTENIKEFTSSDAGRSSTDAPSALDGLMSGALLLGRGTNESVIVSTDGDDSIGALGFGKTVKSSDSLKPRELFRSPSAPPLVPSRRCLMKLKRGMRNCDQPSNEGTPVSIKRPRTFASLSDENNSSKIVDPGLNRSRSYNELDIMKAVDQGSEDLNLVGDFTRRCSLPTVIGRKQDLKYITAETLVEVLKNEHKTGMVDIIDCRYTYEYDGGHIGGAYNVYTEEQLIEKYFNCSKPLWARARQHQAQTGDTRPHILVFHCEFSSERAPKLARYLRNYDRTMNIYPKLHYPEIYILKDGYKEFYRLMKEHCEPCNYIPMIHQDYASELRKFRVKSKTWAGERSKQDLYNRLKNQ